jgi:hypothetical protein
LQQPLPRIPLPRSGLVQRPLSFIKSMLQNGMSHGRNKYQSRENRAQVREVLLREWDLIGVGRAQDEYDAYVGKVYVMLMDEHATAEAIAAYLFEVATGHMGLSDPELAERSKNTAELLIGLRPHFETH